MKSKKGKSWITFNRALKEGRESLEKWVTNVDISTITDSIINLNNYHISKPSAILSKKISFFKSIIKKRNLNIDIRSSTSKAYKTRTKSWTFSFIELYKYDYLLFIGYDDESKTLTYWLVSSTDMDMLAPPKRDTQVINGKKCFSIGIPTNIGSTNWKKYNKYVFKEKNLLNLLEVL